MALTCDIIARYAFGTKINAFEDPDNEFMKRLKQLASEDVEVGFDSAAVSKLIFASLIIMLHY